MTDHTDFSTVLNASQLEAVTYNDGPLLVIAGAGSGKTRVLTYKIAYLIQSGIEPWNILALTFTNKAAREMNNRIAALCGDMNTRGLWSGTFHSLFSRLLRLEAEVGGWKSDFTIYDATDTKSLLKTIVKELNLDEKIYKPNAVAGRISEAKNHLIRPDAYAADATIARRDKADGLGQTARIYSIYSQRLQAADAMDFDDLLLNTFYLLRDNEDVRRRYITRFPFILVDEYQDTNMAQHRILSLLTSENSRICVVGDDAQSIYGFRGADIANILNFEKQYPGAKIVKLECNYRSTQNIVEAANCIIRHNAGQIPKKVYAAGETGERLHVMCAETDKEEAQKAVAKIVRLHRQNVSYDETAILYRTNAQSRVFEEALQTMKVPYRIYGGLSFYQRKEIKDVLAYLRLVVNPDDEEAFVRVVNYPARGIGATTIGHLRRCAAEHGVSLWQVARRPDVYQLPVNRGALGKLGTFCDLIDSFRLKSESETASAITREVIRRSGISVDLAMEHSQESISRQENIDELLGSICSYEKERRDEEGQKRVSVSEYLSTVSLLSDQDTQEEEGEHVTLMTVHAAKGLEFDAVFVTGLEEDLFPNANARLYPAEMEEERRLFYVAVTRAKRYCYLSYARTRYRYGNLQFGEKSPFIDEIDTQYLDEEKPFRSSLYNHSSNTLSGQSPSWKRTNDFDAFFGAPSDDEFRHPESHSRSQASSGGYFARRNDDYTPRRVVPAPPPSGFKKVASRAVAPKSISHTSSTYIPVGTRIHHERFGDGVIIGTDGAGDNTKIQVKFDQVGTKNLLVKFAKFDIL